jgi:hypothetical protein
LVPLVSSERSRGDERTGRKTVGQNWGDWTEKEKKKLEEETREKASVPSFAFVPRTQT